MTRHRFSEFRFDRSGFTASVQPSGLPSVRRADRVQRLWITCDDTRLDAAVRRMLRTPAARVLRWPGAGWTAADEWATGAREALRSAVERFRPDELVLCGHSQCAAADDHSGPRAAGRSTPVASRMPHAIHLDQSSRQKTIRQYLALREGWQPSAGAPLRALRVHCLYYLHACDSFLYLDPHREAFVPVG